MKRGFFSPLQTPVLDKLHPIVFTLNVSLHEQKAAAQQTLQNLDAFPVLSGQQKQTDKTEVQTSLHFHQPNTNLCSKVLSVLCCVFPQINFHKECGDDNTCSSNLQLKAIFAGENYIPFPRWGFLMETAWCEYTHTDMSMYSKMEVLQLQSVVFWVKAVIQLLLLYNIIISIIF